MGILFSIPEETVLFTDIGVDTIMADNMGVMSSGTLTHIIRPLKPRGRFSYPLNYFIPAFARRFYSPLECILGFNKWAKELYRLSCDSERTTRV